MQHKTEPRARIFKENSAQAGGQPGARLIRRVRSFGREAVQMRVSPEINA